ncbi:MAG: hypothetical protein JXR84_08175 [Anaerolineae bacterium]|nr:hypothetical protein [Anaerolineae bacterium]
MLKKWRVIAIIIVWIAFGAANLLRAGMTVYIAPALAEYPPSLSLPLLASVYGLWGVIFLAAAVIAWRRKSISSGTLGLALLYQAVLWIMNLLSYRSTYTRSLWPRDLFLTLIFLVLVALLAGYDRLFKKKA